MQQVEFVQYLSGVVFCSGYLLYIVEIVTKRDAAPAPPILAFGIWFLVDCLQSLSAVVFGTSPAIPLAAAIGIVALISAALIRQRFVLAYDRWSLVTLVVSLITFLGWGGVLLFGRADAQLVSQLVLWLSLFAGLLPVVPLWQALLQQPQTQGVWSWPVWLAGSAIGVSAVWLQPTVLTEDLLLPWSYFVVCAASSFLRFVPVTRYVMIWRAA